MRKIVFILATMMTLSAGAAPETTATKPTKDNSSAQATAPVLEINVSPGEQQLQRDSRYYVNFGRVRVGQTAYRGFTLRNTGYVPLVIRDFDVSGRDFSADDNCPTILRAGQRCSFEVYFSPWMEGYSTGSLYVSTSSGMMTLDLSGWGVRYRY
jgi:hypothetical protein